MTRFRLLLGSALLGLLSTLAGVAVMLAHLASAPVVYTLLSVGIGAGLLFLGLALVEILTSRRASGGSKVAWSALLLVGGTLGGLLYLLVGRREVADVE